ncbi:VOC family protein [Neptunomonas japonica]|uniref:VOC family protein n=1 Tax=Neptunomonas japonica TaxID=417574 RepID=UPI000428012B|nr:VOC family protein [Neptunomonas japonica]
MDIDKTGIILNTEKYDECVAFYQNLFSLKVIFEKNEEEFKLTSFEFGGAYLLVETGGLAKNKQKLISENSTKIRFNVTDIEKALEEVIQYGIAAKIETYEWGKTINITDPDGNRVGIRDIPKLCRSL